VESDDIHSLPALSNARPTGLKHLSGQAVLSGLVSTSVSASLLSAAATGSPVAALKAIDEMR
jgi:hypothetical protein